MTLLAIIGIALEIGGFILIIKSTKKLDLEEGGFLADRYVDPKTRKPPHIESYPIPFRYRWGLAFVIAGLGLQIADIALSDYFNIEISNFLWK